MDVSMSIDPIVLFFLGGITAKIIFPQLKIPLFIYNIISFFLLASIGLKGGIELCAWASWTLLAQVIGVISLSVSTCLIVMFILKRISSYAIDNVITIAAHYGSVSVGTFAIAIGILESAGINYEPYMPLFVALMESPAILMASLMLKKVYQNDQSIIKSVISAFTCKSLLTLLTSILVGYLFGPFFINIIEPVFFAPFKYVLALFLFEMGILVGHQISFIKKELWAIATQAITLSLTCAALGLIMALIMQLSLGGAILLMVLASSASYIAVPAALRHSYPQVNVPLALSYSLGVTFPFNVFIGIHLYMHAATWIFNTFGLTKVAYICN